MVEDLIRRARRRLLLNETLGQTAFAGAVMAGGFALILLLGTRYLEWWTLALFAIAGAGVGIARGWRNSPGAYETALRVDNSADLKDAISTALYFQSATGVSSEFLSAQRAQAENVARGVHVEDAIPFTRPRALYALATLAAFTCLLIGLRFAGGHGLDLSRPLTEVLFEDQAAQRIAKKQAFMDPSRRAKLESAESLLAKLGSPVNPDNKGDPEAALDKAIQDALEGNAPAAGDKGEKGKGGKPEDGKAGNGLSQDPSGDPMQDKKADGGEQTADSKQPGGQQGTAGDKGKNSGGENNNQSLMSKLKDAVKDLMNKAGKQNNSGDKGDQQQSAKSEKSGEKGSSGKGQEQQGQQMADSQSGEPSADSQEGQQSEGKAGSKSSQQSAQAGSGVGSQDGSKDFHAAEQLKAMGKISEIIGKRAQTVSGETSVEVQSGNQQLRTAYSTKQATHGEADSDVSRDEIPVTLHSYVQQYFEQVRKAAPPQSTAAPVNK